MSINRDMRKYVLQKKIVTRSEKSNAPIEEWVSKGTIDAAVYFMSENRITGSKRYKEATHVALTFCRNFKANQIRIVDGDHTYEVISVNPSGRMQELILKEVVQDAG